MQIDFFSLSRAHVSWSSQDRCSDPTNKEISYNLFKWFSRVWFSHGKKSVYGDEHLFSAFQGVNNRARHRNDSGDAAVKDPPDQ